MDPLDLFVKGCTLQKPPPTIIDPFLAFSKGCWMCWIYEPMKVEHFNYTANLIFEEEFKLHTEAWFQLLFFVKGVHFLNCFETVYDWVQSDSFFGRRRWTIGLLNICWMLACCSNICHFLLNTRVYCGQSYKHFTLINYDSRVVPDWKIPHITTLES